MKIVNDLFQDLLDIFAELNPDMNNVIVQFDPTLTDKRGYTMVPIKDKEDSEKMSKFVYISANISVSDAISELAVQLTDLMVSANKENEFLWRVTNKKLLFEAEERMRNRYEDLNLDKDYFNYIEE